MLSVCQSLKAVCFKILSHFPEHVVVHYVKELLCRVKVHARYGDTTPLLQK